MSSSVSVEKLQEDLRKTEERLQKREQTLTHLRQAHRKRQNELYEAVCRRLVDFFEEQYDQKLTPDLEQAIEEEWQCREQEPLRLFK